MSETSDFLGIVSGDRRRTHTEIAARADRIAAGLAMLAPDDPVMAWFERCLDLHESRGRTVTAA